LYRRPPRDVFLTFFCMSLQVFMGTMSLSAGAARPEKLRKNRQNGTWSKDDDPVSFETTLYGCTLHGRERSRVEASGVNTQMLPGET